MVLPLTICEFFVEVIGVILKTLICDINSVQILSMKIKVFTALALSVFKFNLSIDIHIIYCES